MWEKFYEAAKPALFHSQLITEDLLYHLAVNESSIYTFSSHFGHLLLIKDTSVMFLYMMISNRNFLRINL